MPKKINTKLFITFIFYMLIGIAGAYIIGLIDKQRKDYALEVQSKFIESKYQTNYQNFKVMTNEFRIMYQNNEKLISLLFRANDANEQEAVGIRKAIYNLIIKNYKHLNEIGISHVHFYLKNNKSFLSMYKPEKDCKSLLKLDKDIIRTNTFNPMQEGFKLSKLTNGITFAYPLFDQYNQYIAGIEITFSTKQLIDNILDEFSYDAHILISKNAVKNTIIEEELQNNYEESWESDEYILETRTHKQQRLTNLYHTLESEKLQNKIKTKLLTKELYSIHASHEYTNVIMTFLPLNNNVTKANDVYLVVYAQSNYLRELIRENKYLLILFFSFLILMFLSTSYILRSRDKFEKLALFDNVTKLPNRSLFLIELQKEMQRAQRHQTKIALLFIDLDGFKAVNDTYGHQVGDDLLKFCANSFSSDVRKSDTVARIGGDEFVIILTALKDIGESVTIAQKLIDNINKTINIKKHKIRIGASIGISIYPDHGLEETVLVKIADNMMYQSKNSGKNRVTLFSNDSVG